MHGSMKAHANCEPRSHAGIQVSQEDSFTSRHSISTGHFVITSFHQSSHLLHLPRILFSSSLRNRGRAVWFEVIHSEGSLLALSFPPPPPLPPPLSPVSLLFSCQLGVAEGMEAQKNAQQMKWMMRVMAVGMVPLSATFPKVCGRMATYVSRFAVRLVSRFAGQSARR